MALHLHVVADGQQHLLRLLGQFAGGGEDQRLGLHQRGVDVLKNADAEDAGLARTRLRLSNNVSALDDGQNGALLDGGRLFKAYTALVVDWSTQ